jgi:hypothetical protein
MRDTTDLSSPKKKNIISTKNSNNSIMTQDTTCSSKSSLFNNYGNV